MTVSIDGKEFEILDSTSHITTGQTAVLDALSEVVTEGSSNITLSTLTKMFGFSSPAPIISRLKHLIESGRLRVV